MQKLVVDVGDGTYAPTLDAANLTFFGVAEKYTGRKV